MGSPWAALAEAEGIQPLEGRAVLARVDKVRACHRHHRAPRIVFVGISPTADRNRAEAKGTNPLKAQSVHIVCAAALHELAELTGTDTSGDNNCFWIRL